jgi:hypothetical protein
MSDTITAVPETNDEPIKLPSDTEIILNSIKELSKQIIALQSQIREMKQEMSYVNNMRRQPPLHPSTSPNPFYHSNEPPHRLSYNNDYYNNLIGGGRHY